MTFFPQPFSTLRPENRQSLIVMLGQQLGQRSSQDGVFGRTESCDGKGDKQFQIVMGRKWSRPKERSASESRSDQHPTKRSPKRTLVLRRRELSIEEWSLDDVADGDTRRSVERASRARLQALQIRTKASWTEIYERQRSGKGMSNSDCVGCRPSEEGRKGGSWPLGGRIVRRTDRFQRAQESTTRPRGG